MELLFNKDLGITIVVWVVETSNNKRAFQYIDAPDFWNEIPEDIRIVVSFIF